MRRLDGAVKFAKASNVVCLKKAKRTENTQCCSASERSEAK